MSVSIRRARSDDADFLLELVTDDDVQPFLGGRAAADRAAVVAEIERSEREPAAFGRFVIELDGERVGSMGFEVANARSRVAQLERLAVHPAFRGQRLADAAARLLQRHLLLEVGFHRLQLEIYAFNERAIAHTERSGFVREGVRRKAYWRHGTWQDAVLYSLVREDLPEPPTIVDLLRDHVLRFNDGVRSGDFRPMVKRFADDAELVFEGAPVEPLRGRSAIARAYVIRPPDDEIELGVPASDGDTVVAPYSWRSAPTLRAGELRLTRDGDRIVRLVVTFEQGGR